MFCGILEHLSYSESCVHKTGLPRFFTDAESNTLAKVKGGGREAKDKGRGKRTPNLSSRAELKYEPLLFIAN
jgi:hypothetical protein